MGQGRGIHPPPPTLLIATGLRRVLGEPELEEPLDSLTALLLLFLKITEPIPPGVQLLILYCQVEGQLLTPAWIPKVEVLEEGSGDPASVLLPADDGVTHVHDTLDALPVVQADMEGGGEAQALEAGEAVVPHALGHIPADGQVIAPLQAEGVEVGPAPVLEGLLEDKAAGAGVLQGGGGEGEVGEVEEDEVGAAVGQMVEEGGQGVGVQNGGAADNHHLDVGEEGGGVGEGEGEVGQGGTE